MSWIYVTEAGARLGLREGRYVISREHEVLAEVPSEIRDFSLIAMICHPWEHECWQRCRVRSWKGSR